MRALFIGPGLGAGGAERQWSILLPGLRQRGHEVRLIALDAGGPFVAPLREAGIALEVLQMRHQADLRPLLASPILRAFHPDVIVSRGVSGLYVGDALARLRRAGHVFNDHRQVGLPVSRRREVMFRLLARRLDLVITVTPGQADAWKARRYPLERVVAVSNGVPEPSVGASRAEIRAELGFPESALVAVLVASMRPVKRIEDFVAAVQKARQTRPEVVGVVVGDGPARAAIEAAIADPAAIRLLGHRDDVPRVLAAADIFALASEHEAAPMAILEGMATGLPVLATGVGGIPELVADGETGLLVPPRDPDALAAGLLELAGDPERRAAMGAAGRERWRERWGAERMVDGYLAALTRVVDTRAGRAT